MGAHQAQSGGIEWVLQLQVQLPVLLLGWKISAGSGSCVLLSSCTEGIGVTALLSASSSEFLLQKTLGCSVVGREWLLRGLSAAGVIPFLAFYCTTSPTCACGKCWEFLTPSPVFAHRGSW